VLDGSTVAIGVVAVRPVLEAELEAPTVLGVVALVAVVVDLLSVAA
jgi:hypothetical protein